MKSTFTMLVLMAFTMSVGAAPTGLAKPNLDKNGTRGCKNESHVQQTTENPRDADRGSFEAERAGISDG
jgi:hypothetical protein